MRTIQIAITDINQYRDSIIVVNFANRGLLPFKWYPAEEAWLYDKGGDRLNIDHVHDKDDKDILEVSAVSI